MNVQIKNQKDFLITQEKIIECNIDDMNPELYEYIIDKLFNAGAADVYLTNIIMKKGRPAVKLSVLCSYEYEEIIEEIIFKETTTLGIRKYDVEKKMLKREIEVLKTRFGDIRVKNAYYKGEIIKCKPEYDDCKKLSIENHIPISDIYKEVEKKYKQ